MKNAHQKKIQKYIDDACNQDEQQRAFGIAQTAEDAADAIVGSDKNHASGADADIGDRLLQSVGGDVHPLAAKRGKDSYQPGQKDCYC